MSLGTAARSFKSQTCTKGYLPWFKSFPGLLHCQALGLAPIPTPGLNTQPAQPEHPRENYWHWHREPQAFKRQNFLILVSLLPRKSYFVPNQKPWQPRDMQRRKAVRSIFVCSMVLVSGMETLYLFGEEDLLIFSWICLSSLYQKRMMI